MYVISAVDLMNECLFFLNHPKNWPWSFDLVRLKLVDIQNGKHCHADHVCDFHPLVEHMNQLRNFIGEIREFSAVPFSYF